MKPIWIITKRELNSYFDSLIAYFILAIFLGFSGFLTWLAGSDIFRIGQATLLPFFRFAYWTLLFFIPAVTMRMIAEEKKTGTIELLLTKAITDRQVILGKFLASVILICIALLCTLPYVITVASYGNLDLGVAICGYLGLILMSSAYVSIGLYMSSLTGNQITALLLSWIICLIFGLLLDIIANTFTGIIGETLSLLSFSTHFESIQRGVIDLKDIIFFLSVTFLGLFMSEISLSKRKITG